MKNTTQRNKFTITFFFIFLFVPFSYGWGKEGHTIVAEVAKHILAQNIQDSVQKYLGDVSWGNAATWMDDVRSKHSYDYMKPWHYINIEKNNNYTDTIAQGNNITVQLSSAIEKLKNRKKLSKEEVALNLKIIFHLTGDLHQPLHVGYGIDRGGNDIKVFFDTKTVSLHHLWDGNIIEYSKITTESIESLYAKTSSEKLKNTSKINIIAWMNEARKELQNVYDFKDKTISEEYVSRNTLVVQMQLLKAGIRLASILEDIFNN